MCRSQVTQLGSMGQLEPHVPRFVLTFEVNGVRTAQGCQAWQMGLVVVGACLLCKHLTDLHSISGISQSQGQWWDEHH